MGIQLVGTSKCLYSDYRHALTLRGWDLSPSLSASAIPGRNPVERYPAEAYAVVAVVIAPLPDALEEHYSQFFTNRQAVIDILMAVTNDQAWDGTGYSGGSSYSGSRSNGCQDGPPSYSWADPIPQL